jgi:hypothetical protein
MTRKSELELNSRDESKNTLVIFLKIILLFYLALIAFPYRFSPITPGLDPSWIFAINYFADRHIIFGKDVIWPYGPLGFISMPLNVGYNLDIATIFQLSLWIMFSTLIAYLAFKNYVSLLQLFLFVLLFSGGQALYYFGYIGYDYCIAFYILLLLSLALYMKRWYIYYISALLLSVLVMFIKCSSLLFAGVSIVFFIVVTAFVEREKALKAGVLSLSVPVLFVLFYLLYYPSFSSLISYLRGMYELTSGYNVAMSSPGKTEELYLALSTSILYFLFMLFLLKSKQRSFAMSLMFLGPLFLAFKHGFVRQDTHTMIFFSTPLYMVGLLILFTDLSKFLKRAILLVGAFISIWVLVAVQYISTPSFMLSGITGLITLNNMKATLHYGQTKRFLDVVAKDALQTVRLSEDFLSKIGKERIGIFPWEISYAAANNLNYVPFPVIQADNAYTSYLDFLNADFLEDNEKAPILILTEWTAVDGRHPLIDAPAMWLSMFKWYDSFEKNGEILLLKRRDSPRFVKMELIEKKVYRAQEIVELPAMDNPLVAKISLKLNTSGKLSKLFFRIGEVRMSLFMESGRIEDYRVVPDTLEDGLLVNLLPVNLNGIEDLLDNNQVERVRGFKIHGKGLDSYKRKMIIEFYRIPGL